MGPERSALLLAPEAPYPVAGGGPLRTASILEYLGRRYTLDVVVFREPGAPDPRLAFPSGLARTVHVIDLPYHSKTLAARAARNLVRLMHARPPLNDRFAGFGGDLSGFLEGRRYDVAVIEHFWCAPYLEQVAPHAERVILDLHNVESALYARLAESEPWPASFALARFGAAAARMERRWVPGYSSVLAASEEEAVRVRPAAGKMPVHVYPNTTPLVPRPLAPEENIIAFSGNLEYRPNISAVGFFRSQVWPALREEWPELKWRLIGKNPEAIAKCVEGDARIEVRGPVEDAVEALGAACVVVVPLLAGGGTRVKILEAWAAGRAVVSTSAGAEGLGARDGEHLLVRDTAASLAQAVSSLLASPGDRARLGAAGRELWERQFTWERAWEILAKIGV